MHLNFGKGDINCRELILLGKSIEKNKTLSELFLANMDLCYDEKNHWYALDQFFYSLQLNPKIHCVILPSNFYRSDNVRVQRTMQDATKQESNYFSNLIALTNRNSKLSEYERKMERDDYFLTAVVLFQGIRSNHRYLNCDICYSILSMLSPTNIKKYKLEAATDLIAKNINSRKWETKGQVIYPSYGLKVKTLFRKWEKYEESFVGINRAAKLGCKF